MILKERDNESIRALTNNIIQTKKFYNGKSFTAPMISSNYILSSNPKIEEIRKSLLSNDKNGELLKNQSVLSFEIINGSTVQEQQHMMGSTQSLLPFRPHGSVDQKSIIFTNKPYTESNSSLTLTLISFHAKIYKLNIFISNKTF